MVVLVDREDNKKVQWAHSFTDLLIVLLEEKVIGLF